MIIWIRERKGWVGVVFCVMIGIFAASFVIGGVGSGNNASLSDIFGNGNLSDGVGNVTYGIYAGTKGTGSVTINDTNAING